MPSLKRRCAKEGVESRNIADSGQQEQLEANSHQDKPIREKADGNQTLGPANDHVSHLTDDDRRKNPVIAVRYSGSDPA